MATGATPRASTLSYESTQAAARSSCFRRSCTLSQHVAWQLSSISNISVEPFMEWVTHTGEGVCFGWVYGYFFVTSFGAE